MSRYIYQQPDWPHFFWDHSKLSLLLTRIHQRLGRILGTLQALGFDIQNETLLNTLTLDVIKSSDIEGEILDPEQVRSSIARRLGLKLEKYAQPSRPVEGAVQVMLDATQHYDQPITATRLCEWQYALFRGDLHGAYIRVGDWRNDQQGPMQVVSGPLGRERVHFEAPPAHSLEKEMNQFIDWINQMNEIDPILQAAIAHFWFVTIHPFEDGNGRIARAITEWVFARHEQSSKRFYSMSAQIRQERKMYYAILETTSKGTLDITAYLEWFLQCLDRTFDNTDNVIATVLNKSKFWELHAHDAINERQRMMINKLFDGFFGKLTTTKWGKIAKCSQDSALRDINALIDMEILAKDPAGGRSTSYSLDDRWRHL